MSVRSEVVNALHELESFARASSVVSQSGSDRSDGSHSYITPAWIRLEEELDREDCRDSCQPFNGSHKYFYGRHVEASFFNLIGPHHQEARQFFDTERKNEHCITNWIHGFVVVWRSRELRYRDLHAD